MACLFGTIGSVLSAFLFKIDKNAINAELFGYNGVLVGIGIALFHFGNDKNWLEMP